MFTMFTILGMHSEACGPNLPSIKDAIQMTKSGQVRGFPKPVGFILWGPWQSMPWDISSGRPHYKPWGTSWNKHVSHFCSNKGRSVSAVFADFTGFLATFSHDRTPPIPYTLQIHKVRTPRPISPEVQYTKIQMCWAEVQPRCLDFSTTATNFSSWFPWG